MNLAFTYALLAGVSMATYVIGLRLASSETHPALGTALVTGIAFLLNVAVTLAIRATGAPVSFSMKSVYSGARRRSWCCWSGSRFLKEPFTWTKLLAIGMIAAGTFLLRWSDV